jgi:hypothetical protein
MALVTLAADQTITGVRAEIDLTIGQLVTASSFEQGA